MSKANGSSDGMINESTVQDSERRQLVVTARWALIFGCAYLILFGNRPVGPGGLAIIALFLGSNLLLGRLRLQGVGQQTFAVSIGAMDTLLIVASLYLGGQLNPELLVLFLGVLVLAIAGLPLWCIGAVTVSMSAVYLAIVWGVGGSIAQREMLLRAPFLLGAALGYASLMESRAGARPERTADTIAHGLALQLEAIRRCQAALATGTDTTVHAALREIEGHNRTLQACIGESMPVANEPIPVMVPTAV